MTELYINSYKSSEFATSWRIFLMDHHYGLELKIKKIA